LKEQFCVRGDRQIQDVDYFDTFSPVVNWMTIQSMLILSAVMSLATRQVDYTAAFTQAPLHEEVFVKMPQLFQEQGKVLKLKKKLYSL
jgi:hypothetical protein